MHQEGTSRSGLLELTIVVVALMMIAYQIINAFYSLQSYNGFMNTHLGFALILIFLSTLRGATKRHQIFSLGMLLLSFIPIGYVYLNVQDLEWASGLPPTPVIVVMSAILTVVLVEACRRAVGTLFTMVILVFLLYSFTGFLIPGFFHGAYVSPERIIARVGIGSLGTEGVYGFILGMSADTIFLFVVFGGLFQVSGATRFFIEIGKSIQGKLAGGPALTAVITSSMVGMVTGSVAANVATIGSFTIPLMKKIGYRAEQAGGIEAVASTGGQIMPPVMGAAAFIMVAFTGIPYATIMAVAILPAILYYLSLAFYVQFQAMKMGLKSSDTERESVDAKTILISGPLFLIPLVFLIFMLSRGYPLSYTISLAIGILVLLSFIRKETRASPGNWIQAFTEGAVSASQVAVTCACLGLMVTSLSVTGLLLKIPTFVADVSGGSLILALVLTMIASLILGCGISVAATYVLIAVVACPVLVKMGVPVLQAHFFNFYYACLAMLTPPVAIGAIVAAKIAGANFLKTSIEALKACAGGFIVPFLLIVAPVLVLMPRDLISGIAGIISSILIIMLLQVVICGQYITSVGRFERIIYAGLILLFLISLILGNYFLTGAAVIMVAAMTLRQLRKAKTVERSLRIANYPNH